MRTELEMKLYEKGISIEEVCRCLGGCYSTAMNKIKGRSKWTLDDAQNMAGLLGMSLDETGLLLNRERKC